MIVCGELQARIGIEPAKPTFLMRGRISELWGQDTSLDSLDPCLQVGELLPELEYRYPAGQLLMLLQVESDCVLVNATRYPIEWEIPTVSASHAKPLRSELRSRRTKLCPPKAGRSEFSNAAKIIDAISLCPIAIIRGCPVSS